LSSDGHTNTNPTNKHTYNESNIQQKHKQINVILTWYKYILRLTSHTMSTSNELCHLSAIFDTFTSTGYQTIYISCVNILLEAVSGFTQTDFTITTGTGTADITGSVTAKQAENIAAATTLFTLTPTQEAGGDITFAFTATGNPGDVAEITATTTVATVKLAAGKSLDFETSPAITFVITLVIHTFIFLLNMFC